MVRDVIQILKKAESRGYRLLNRTHMKLTPIDLLFKYGKVYHVDLRDRSMVTEVPKKLKDLEERLGLNIYPLSDAELQLRS